MSGGTVLAAHARNANGDPAFLFCRSVATSPLRIRLAKVFNSAFDPVEAPLVRKKAALPT
jgi:hypothetical protein